MALLDEIEAVVPALRRYARALCRDRDGADDLVQDCLERALASRSGWRGDGPVRAWLFRILLNLFRDGRRSRDALNHLVAVDLLAEPAQDAGQEAHLALRELALAVRRLPADQRAALLLVTVEGMSIGEAARVLEIPEGTVASRIARARAGLRVLMGRETAPASHRRDASR